MSQFYCHLCESLFFCSQAQIVCPLLCTPNSLSTILIFLNSTHHLFFSWNTESFTSEALPYSFFVHLMSVMNYIPNKCLLVNPCNTRKYTQRHKCNTQYLKWATWNLVMAFRVFLTLN